jgi:hypothetical protein
MNTAHLIQYVVDFHNAATDGCHLITRCPDQQNRTTADIDAYAEDGRGRPLAIEHTKIDSFPGQRRDSAWFQEALGALETDLEGAFPFWLGIEVPYENVRAGEDWAAIRSRLRDWLQASAWGMPLGRTTRAIDGVPFAITVSKHDSLQPGVFLMRHVPPGDREALLREKMDEALDHKYARLGEYKRAGAVAVVVLESDVIALVSPQDLYAAFVLATHDRPRPDLDEVWLACPSGDRCEVYCFFGADEVAARVNPPNFRFGPRFASGWLGMRR